MTELVLVRHGRTAWNDEGRYQGQDGPGLNAQGRAQAAATARALAQGPPAAALYSSDLPRALETAHIIGGVLGLPVQADPRLRELHQGAWQGMLYPDIQARYGQELQRFRADPWRYGPPGGETLAHLLERLAAALDDIATRHPHARVIVVTHKLPIAALRCLEAGRPLSAVWDAIPQNAEAVVFPWPLRQPHPSPPA